MQPLLVMMLFTAWPVQQPTGPSMPPLPPARQHALEVQVMLARAGFSPGEIDASMGANTKKALDAYTGSGHQLKAAPTDEPLTSYTISDEDAAGPFTPDIPQDMMEQAKLPALGYRNVLEAIAERFHASPTLLKQLNPGKTFGAGEQIVVPNVVIQPKPVGTSGRQGGRPAGAAEVTVTVSRAKSALTVTDASGQVLFYAPVTTGSEHDPLPIGEWTVKGVQRNPPFHYNPDLFWDAQPKDEKATIPPGPNNPVGVVWIDLSRPHYGLHGTPEPSMVGKTASHGCIRLTNWDAMTVASLVGPGTPVIFTP
jgi:lipoprotein-anchoring transpeptidase ErfK/SrfK